jgi:beta-lactamase regulating signal transducer with metallopeptidase domain
METYLTPITNYLLTQSWQIAILVVVIAVATLALRNRSAHVRYLLWLIVLAKCLVPPLMTVPLAVLPQDEYARVPMLERAAAPKVEPVSLPSAPAPPAPPTRTVSARPARFSPRHWLGLAWIVGVVVFALVAVTKPCEPSFG